MNKELGKEQAVFAVILPFVQPCMPCTYCARRRRTPAATLQAVESTAIRSESRGKLHRVWLIAVATYANDRLFVPMEALHAIFVEEFGI